MEQFLLEHASRHEMLVKKFKPPCRKPTDQQDTATNTSPNIVVATRIRPMLEDEVSSGQVIAAFPREGHPGIVDIHELRRVARGPPPLNSSSFKTGSVFGATVTTEAIYEDTVRPIIPYAWQGNIGTLFAYGQTGSGKTYTVSGLERLIAKSLFDGSLPGEREVYVCMFELAGNSAFDLFNSRAPFSILEDSLGNTQLVGIQERHVQSTEELLVLVESANKCRQTAATVKNDGSSRSHAICQIRLRNPAASAEDGILYLIDLAGSEAARDIFHHSSDRMKETREINISLSILKDCIRGMANTNSTTTGKSTKKAKPYIPFRQSTLTKVLKHLFDPTGSRECKTAVLACVNPSFLDTGATKNTLRYAQMLCSAEPARKPVGYDPAVPATWDNKNLRNYIMIKFSGVSPSDLAPSESGAQLLQLPVEEFVRRCLKSQDVTEEHAKAFHEKLWMLHIDSRKMAKNQK